MTAAIAGLASGNSWFAGLHQVMPPTKSKLYTELYDRVRYFTDKEVNDIGKQSMTTKGASTAHKSQPREDTESLDAEEDQDQQ